MIVESLVTSLREVNPTFDIKCHMSCVAHVINLIVQEGLRYMEILEEFIAKQMTDLVEDDELLIFSITSTSMRKIVY